MIIENQLQVTDAVIDELRRAKNPRLKEIMTSLITHLHAFAREVKLTEQEFNAGINIVARLGQLTTASHNEVRLMAGSLGLSMLVCLLNNGDGSDTERGYDLGEPAGAVLARGLARHAQRRLDRAVGYGGHSAVREGIREGHQGQPRSRRRGGRLAGVAGRASTRARTRSRRR